MIDTNVFISSFFGGNPRKIIDQDPDDSKFIECAVALKCNAIISGDKHLTAVEQYMGIKIVTPSVFLAKQAPGLSES